MSYRFAMLAALGAAFSISIAGQTAKPASAVKSKTYTPPKTPWGEPDLQGNWPAQFNIPRERPNGVQSAVASDEESLSGNRKPNRSFKRGK
jgi:hypothetical protein